MFSRQALQWIGRSTTILGSLAFLGSCLPLLSHSQSIPSPEEALQQAESFSPEELVNLEIDEEIRDRLRFDPEWRPIYQAIQQDLMRLKWTDAPLENPVWEQYGAKAYPLLAYYTRSNDPTRQKYGMAGIRALGKPYTTLWLEQQIQRRAYNPDFYSLTNNPALFLNPNSDAPYDVDWQTEFGLNDPGTRDRLVKLAQENLEPPAVPTYHYQFNLAFLANVLGYEAVFPYPEFPEPFDPEADPAIQQWRQLEAMQQPTEAQKQEAIALYRSLTSPQQDYVLVTRLGSIKAGEIPPLGQAVLEALAADPDAPDRVWAIAELDRHGIPAGSTLLKQILNEDLAALSPLSQWASYRSVVRVEGIDRATHAYYLLLGMIEKYPDSHFARAAREYGDLTGRSYFGGEPRPDSRLDALAAMTPAQRVTAWQTWITHYAGHPGTDDASYHLARALQDSDRPEEAMQWWLTLMTNPTGDQDAIYLAWGHVRTMLDVGLTSEQLEAVVQANPESAIAPLLRYALAVHYARHQDYTRALETSAELDLTTMDPEILNRYYQTVYWYATEDQYSQIQQEMQAMLTEQRTRWQRLQSLQAEGTPESLYALASDWAGRGGWKNGYLALWNDGRTSFLPTGDWSIYYCQIYWSCNEALRGTETVRESYQQASQNAIALSLYQQLIDTPETPADLREKALYMAASTLLWQWENHPVGETIRIHAPAGVPSTGALATPPPVDPLWDLRIRYEDGNWESDPDYAAIQAQSEAEFEIQQANYNQVSRDYIAYLDQAIAQLQGLNPTSPYLDDLLFSRYVMSGDRQILQTLAEQYPTGDRTAEARFLLEHEDADLIHWR